MRSLDTDNVRRRVVTKVIDDIADAEVISYHVVDMNYALDYLDARCMQMFRWIVREAPKKAYGCLNLFTFVGILGAVLMFGPQAVGANPIYLVDQTVKWSVADSPVYIEGESDGANHGVVSMLKAYNYPIVQTKEEARFVVSVDVHMEKPKTCTGYHRGRVTLWITDLFTSKKTEIKSSVLTEKISCFISENQSELDKALYVAVLRENKTFFSPFTPDEDGQL